VLLTAANLAILRRTIRVRAVTPHCRAPKPAGNDGAIGAGLMLASPAQRWQDPLGSAKLGQRAIGLLQKAGDRHGLALAVAQTAPTAALCDRFDEVRRAGERFTSPRQG
jgi:hypothetical protein